MSLLLPVPIPLLLSNTITTLVLGAVTTCSNPPFIISHNQDPGPKRCYCLFQSPFYYPTQSGPWPLALILPVPIPLLLSHIIRTLALGAVTACSNPPFIISHNQDPGPWRCYYLFQSPFYYLTQSGPLPLSLLLHVPIPLLLSHTIRTLALGAVTACSNPLFIISHNQDPGPYRCYCLFQSPFYYLTQSGPLPLALLLLVPIPLLLSHTIRTLALGAVTTCSNPPFIISHNQDPCPCRCYCMFQSPFYYLIQSGPWPYALLLPVPIPFLLSHTIRTLALGAVTACSNPPFIISHNQDPGPWRCYCLFQSPFYYLTQSGPWPLALLLPVPIPLLLSHIIRTLALVAVTACSNPPFII